MLVLNEAVCLFLAFKCDGNLRESNTLSLYVFMYESFFPVVHSQGQDFELKTLYEIKKLCDLFGSSRVNPWITPFLSVNAYLWLALI